VSQRRPSTFDLLPAIDLRGGHVVRLEQGDFDRERVYASDPAVVAAGFAAMGAPWIHVVDLDGAKAGERRQGAAVSAITDALSGTITRLEVAGGLRTAEAIDDILDNGADRIVVGSAALRDPALVAAAIARHGTERIVVALDIRDGMAVGDGWVDGAAGEPIWPALDQLTGIGVGTFAVTAIARDGLLGGPDLDLLRVCVGATPAAIVASGGIRSIDDLRAVRAIGCSGAIVGRALYDGSLDLTMALASL
jgi:phosphoribosylformimino-5-aminoimidazole carboxamide ribotide isomerase